MSVALDIADTAPIPLARHVKVELRKLVDTRAGRWLLIIQAILIVAASTIVIIVVAVNDEPMEFMDFTTIAGTVMGFLLPVMGILAITSEWSQRTNMATFTLEPRRGRVVSAKLLAVVIAALASVVIAIGIGYVSSAVAALVGVDVDWSTDVEMLAAFALAQVLGLVTAFAFGTLLLSTPGAIVCTFGYFTVLPGVFAIAAELSWFADVRPWLDFNDAQVPLTDFGQDASEIGFGAVDWPQFVVSGLIWFALPLVLGINRVMRAEVK